MQALWRTCATRAALVGCAFLVTEAIAGATCPAPSAPQVVVPPPPPPPSTTGETDFRVYWKKGLNFESGDKQFTFGIGGRLQNDWWFITDQSEGLKSDLAGRTPPLEQESGTNFRRARINMDGTLWGNTVFAWAYDFAENGTAAFKDAYIGWNDVPGLGTVLVGQQKEPIGFEFAYSSNYATFMERGLPHYMNPERSTGVRFYQTAAEEAVYLTAGAFRPSNQQGASGLTGDAWSLAGRVAWSPIFEDKGEKLLHLGINGSYRTGLDVYGRSARPEINGMARYLVANVTDVDDVLIGGLETSVNLGPFSVQGEYVVNSIGQNSGASSTWTGWYAYVSYFITGEYRPYSRKRAAYSGVTPNHDLGNHGSGAWEVALRYSTLDLADGDNSFTTTSGQLDDITAGVNWYMNYNMRIMLNYVHADLDGVGTSDAVGMRFQVFF